MNVVVKDNELHVWNAETGKWSMTYIQDLEIYAAWQKAEEDRMKNFRYRFNKLHWIPFKDKIREKLHCFIDTII